MEIFRIEIPLYVRHVKLSNARRPTFYKKGDKIPKKYLNKERYDFIELEKGEFLFDLDNSEKVIKNSKVVGTPRVIVINGQSLYNGAIAKHTRNKVVETIEQEMHKFIKQFPKIEDYPINIIYEYHDLVRDPISKNKLFDIRNREVFYGKCIEDCLTRNNKIEDDNILFLTGISYKFIPTEGERKIVIIINKETDNRILKNKPYEAEQRKEKSNSKKSSRSNSKTKRKSTKKS